MRIRQMTYGTRIGNRVSAIYRLIGDLADGFTQLA
jgi:hypothetical protein